MKRIVFILIGAGLLVGGALFQRARPQPSLHQENTVVARTAMTQPVLVSEVKAVPGSASDPETATRQMRTLEEILASKNDNDSRLDSELKVLSEETKALFRAKYQAIAPEKRNERGTIVFLLGRNLTTLADYDFLKQVLSEHPCLSLADCSRPMGPAADEDHHAGSIAVLLAYPQLTVLKALQNSSPVSPELSAAAHAALAAARASSSPLVASYSERVQLK